MVLTILAGFEGVIGFYTGNVHIIRDFLTGALMVGGLILSYNAAQNARRKKSTQFSFGLRRLNIWAAFVNMVYIMCNTVFSFIDNLHHTVEHWEQSQH